jgi:glucose/arabinose dehydrogenase
MHKGWRVALVSLLVILVAVGGYLLVRLSQWGYLPGRVSLTAPLPPTTIPLATATEGFEGVATPTPVATPVPVVTSTPVPVEGPTATSEPTVTPEVMAPTTPTVIAAPPYPVSLPEGFGISVFAEALSGPRMMTVGPDGHAYLAERGAGRIVRLPDRDADGVADAVEVVASGLSAPSSLAFYEDGSLYVGETTRVLRITLSGDPPVADEIEVIVDGLPSGGHNTRTVLFSPDWAWLYVSVGSSCNVCIESDPRRAAIVRYRPDGSDETIYATGMRNAVGMTFRPGTDELWVTNNGRDWLGDDQPPETIYLVREGDDAGFPRCHSGRIIDPDYGSEGDCDGVADPVVEMQAHSAPLGLGFYSGTQFPEVYQGALYVAFHGSWNRSEATGYSVVRIPLDGDQVGGVTDFATGWLREDGSRWGRPVDVVTAGDGSMLISDDGEGRIFRIFYAGP